MIDGGGKGSGVSLVMSIVKGCSVAGSGFGDFALLNIENTWFVPACRT
jgi:hypothetical protein